MQRALFSGDSSAYNRAMPVTLRAHEPRDFAALLRLDQACFPPGISYSKTMLRYFLKLPSADGTVAEDDGKIVGFVLTEENPPLAHVITLDVAESHRRQGVGTALLVESERNLALRGVRTVLLETAINNEAGVAFWQRRGYRIEATLKRYYLRSIDAYEMRKLLTGAGKTGKHRGENV
jgi:ribosomal protein S18 acetylase RimI-like enzyme